MAETTGQDNEFSVEQEYLRLLPMSPEALDPEMFAWNNRLAEAARNKDANQYHIAMSMVSICLNLRKMKLGHREIINLMSDGASQARAIQQELDKYTTAGSPAMQEA